MDINYKYIKIFQNLQTSKDGLQLYTLYRRYGLSPSEAIGFINEYSSRGIIRVIDETTIVLTPKGHDNIKEIISEIRRKESDSITYLMKLRSVPMDKYAPYIPMELLSPTAIPIIKTSEEK